MTVEFEDRLLKVVEAAQTMLEAIDANARFIAAAPTLLRQAIMEVRARDQQIDLLMGQIRLSDSLHEEARDRLEAENAKLREVALDAGAGLVAALSVIRHAERGKNVPSAVYASDTMFHIAMDDFDKKVERLRAALGSDQETEE